MFFIFQREPCFIFIGKIKVNFNSNPFGYLAAYVRCLQFELLSLDGVKRKAPHVKTANFKPNNKKTENVVFFFKYMIQIIYNSIRTRSCIV